MIILSDEFFDLDLTAENFLSLFMNQILNPDKPSRSRLADVLLTYAVFAALGVTDGLISVAWPSIRAEFGLPVDALGMLLFTVMTGYLLISFFSGRVISRYPAKWLTAAGCLMVASGFTVYILAPAWLFILTAGIMVGAGNGLISSAISADLASRFSPRITQWLHACYGVGITLGPLAMTYSVTRLDTWRWGYILVITIQFILFSVHIFTSGQDRNKSRLTDQNHHESPEGFRPSISQSLKERPVILSILFFFFYAGLESTMGNWSYTLLTTSRGINPEAAGVLVGSFWGVYTLSRILAGFTGGKTGMNKMILYSVLISLAGGILLIISGSAAFSIAGVLIFGFAIAPVYPGMMASTTERTGRLHTPNTIGMQIGAAGFGVAVIPGNAGLLAGVYGMESIPPVLAVLSLILLFLLFLMHRSSSLNHK